MGFPLGNFKGWGGGGGVGVAVVGVRVLSHVLDLR